MKTVAILIPTRKRVNRLIETIKSIIETTKDASVEICLRVDGDDNETMLAIPYIFSLFPNTRVLIGQRMGGYLSLSAFYNELSKVCDARWIFIMNDDITLEGCGWVEQLERISTTGVLVWPECYQLGGSRYETHGSAYVCPIVPNRCWDQFGRTEPGTPIDVWFTNVLRNGHNWRTEVLKGLTVNHNRDADEEIAKHRQ